MSCLKKVIDTVETECGKSFTNVVLWSDGMDTKFQSRFIFQPLAGKMFLISHCAGSTMRTPWQSPQWMTKAKP